MRIVDLYTVSGNTLMSKVSYCGIPGSVHVPVYRLSDYARNARINFGLCDSALFRAAVDESVDLFAKYACVPRRRVYRRFDIPVV